MNSSYKLIGAFWDQAQRIESENQPLPFDPEYHDASEPRNLFDLLGEKRSIALSRLLEVESAEEMEAIISELRLSASVAIILDYLPRSSGIVHIRFFRHRALQAIKLLKTNLPSAEIVTMKPFEHGGRAA